MQLISAFFEPRLNSVNNLPSLTSKILIRVPLSYAVANKVPFLLTQRHAIFDSCALIIGGCAKLLKYIILTLPFDSYGNDNTEINSPGEKPTISLIISKVSNISIVSNVLRLNI